MPLVSALTTISPTVELHEIVQALQDAYATRYLSAVGLVILFYDHILTFTDEVKLVWKAPTSFPKYAFLFNKYLVLANLLVVAHEMCGFAGKVKSDLGCVSLTTHLGASKTYETCRYSCKQLISTTAMLSLASTAIGNILVLLRVVILWDRRSIVLKLMMVGFFASFITQTVMMITTLIKFWPGIVWNSTAGMCITQYKSPFFIGVWASPMLFEVLVLFSSIFNALHRPQQAELPLTRSLHRDGIAYFFAVTCFRILNLSLAIVAQASLTMVGAFWIWGMTTTILNRALLRMRKIELDSKGDPAGPTGRSSPSSDRGVVIIDMDAPTERSPRWLELNKLSSQ